MEHHIKRDQVIYAMSNSHEAVKHVQPGDRIVFETEDCFSHKITLPEHRLSSDFDYSIVNPATGPIWIEGAEPGDVLVIRIEKIELDTQGVVELFPGWGPLGDKVTGSHTEIVSIQKGKGHFCGLELPLRPMIGVIGVAPAEGEIACGIPGTHGGNLDTIQMTEGATLRLPVYVPGGKLALGDLHAIMGDGEVCGTGVEIRGEVTLTVELEKGRRLITPLLENKDAYFVLASAQTLEEATRIALDEAVTLICEKRGMTWERAYMFASIACDLHISQVVNPLKTVKVRIPK
ncbi:MULTISPECIES: acetamidase/formamidase family protein [Aminobacterium]|jgi:amidase|uniref:acetamidase/formamidase family protein n=1 Tax=Aminobacterium TaxID=81466 RepID=UPI00257B58A6|nr:MULTISPECIES: acetamidase/formamidase family protein [unclassified Aminobacterium]